MNKEKEEFDEFSKAILDNMRVTNELYFHQFGDALKQKDLWLIQLITIFNYYNLSRKQNLTELELKWKQESLEYSDNILKEIGYLKEGGALGNLSEKLDNKKIDWNYLLILGFFISTLIIIFPNYFEVVWYWLNNIQFNYSLQF